MDDPLCSFCGHEMETILHLFCNCNVIKMFWEHLNTLLVYKCVHCQNISFSEELIIFGTKKGVDTDITVELIILVAKFLLYKKNPQRSRPVLNVSEFSEQEILFGTLFICDCKRKPGILVTLYLIYIHVHCWSRCVCVCICVYVLPYVCVR